MEIPGLSFKKVGNFLRHRLFRVMIEIGEQAGSPIDKPLSNHYYNSRKESLIGQFKLSYL